MADEYDVVFDRESLLSAQTSQHSQNKNKVLTTFCLCAAFFTLGLCIAIPGPTLLDLQENTHSNASEIASMFTGRSAGYLLGSVFGGFLFDRVNQSLLLSIVLLLTAVTTAIVPLSQSLAVLIVLILFQGVSMGFLDTGGNVALLHTWGRDSAPYMQALHFSFGLGAFLAPLIAETLLMRPTDNYIVDTVGNKTLGNKTLVNYTSVTRPGLAPVMYSYIIVSMLLVLVGLVFLIVWSCVDKCQRRPISADSPLKSEYTVRQDRKCFRVQLLLLLSAFYFLYVGMEVTYGALIVRFAVEYLHWNKVQATWLNSVFWGTFALARGLAVPAAHCLTPMTLLTTDLVLTTLALSALVVGDSVDATVTVFNVPVYELIVWSCTAMLGIGFSSIFPAGISWAERYIRITGKATAVFVVGSALGEMVVPALTGFLVASQNAMWLMYIELAATITCVVLFIVMCNLACSAGERYQKLSSDDIQPLHPANADDAACDDEDDDDNAGSSSLHGSLNKKHVTFDLVSASLSQTKSVNSAKNSILKTKSTVKKD